MQDFKLLKKLEKWGQKAKYTASIALLMASKSTTSSASTQCWWILTKKGCRLDFMSLITSTYHFKSWKTEQKWVKKAKCMHKPSWSIRNWWIFLEQISQPSSPSLSLDISQSKHVKMRKNAFKTSKLMCHHCHHWNASPPAPQPLEGFLSFLYRPDPFKPINNAWRQSPPVSLGSSQNGRRRPQKGNIT